jgi:hypothetical protein
MKEITQLLREAEAIIDGEMDCGTAAQRALDKLECAVALIALKLEASEKTARSAARTASCLANGIQPD